MKNILATNVGVPAVLSMCFHKVCGISVPPLYNRYLYSMSSYKVHFENGAAVWAELIHKYDPARTLQLTGDAAGVLWLVINGETKDEAIKAAENVVRLLW